MNKINSVCNGTAFHISSIMVIGAPPDYLAFYILAIKGEHDLG